MVDLQRDAVLSRFVSEVAAIRSELGLREVHLLGHSWGAAVAIEYLLTAGPKGGRSVIFVGPLFGIDRWVQDADGFKSCGGLPDNRVQWTMLRPALTRSVILS